MVSKIAPSRKKINVHLIETSPAMRALQQEKVVSSNIQIHWHNSINEITTSPWEYTMLVAHEFFDVLPIHILQVRRYLYMNCSFSKRHLCYRKCRPAGMKFLLHQTSKKKRPSQTLMKAVNLRQTLLLLHSGECWHEILHQHQPFWAFHLLGFETSLLVLSLKYRLQPSEQRTKSDDYFPVRILETTQLPWEDVV